MTISNPKEALTSRLNFLYSLIRYDRLSSSRTLSRQELRADLPSSVPRLSSFLSKCFPSWPDLGFSVIHVAGTSGKGSTTCFLSSCLRSCGVRVGRHVSPFVQSPLEKLVSDERMSSVAAFVESVDSLESVSGVRELRYGEAWVALTALWMRRAAVEWCVLETGVGGRFDATNAIHSKIQVLTSVGMDHVEVLGDSLEEIAWHKAGIIEEGGIVLTAERNEKVLEVFREEARKKNATLFCIDQDFWIETDEKTNQDKEIFNVRSMFDTYTRIKIGLEGKFQMDNACLAVATLDAMRHFLKEDRIQEPMIREGILQARLPGRFEVFSENVGSKQVQVVLDGSHSGPKMKAFIESLLCKYPDSRFVVVIGLIRSKDPKAILECFRPIREKTDQWIATEIHNFAKPSVSADEMHEHITRHVFSDSAGYENDPVIHNSPKVGDAICKAIEFSEKSFHAGKELPVIVVTGSIYLIGEARDRWVPEESFLV